MADSIYEWCLYFQFFNVVADRLPREESVVRGRSHWSMYVGRPLLFPLELIPYKLGGFEESVKAVKQPFRNDDFYLNVWVERHLYAAE